MINWSGKQVEVDESAHKKRQQQQRPAESNEMEEEGMI